MRIARFLMLSLIFMALAPAMSHAQDKTLGVRPLSDFAPIVKRAVVIAVSDYENANHLPETINDARLYVNLLRNRFGFPEDAITVMTDAPGTPERLRPTYTHLVATLDALISGVNEQSEVVVIFTGHGTRLGDHDYLVPLDGAPESVKATCYDYDEFKSRLKTRNPARALLVVDACRDLSGKGNESGVGGGKADLGPQIAELVSCQPKEVSQVGKPEDFRESVFTHFLLQGLEGDPESVNEAGLVTFDSLKQFVRAKVSRYVANKFTASQNPDGNTTLGSMVLARGAGPDKLLSTEGSLLITSEPSGATVTIDDEVKGKTPLTVTLDLGLLPKKSVQVGIGNLAGFKDQLFPVDALRGRQVPRLVTLLPNKAMRPGPLPGKAPHLDPQYGELVEIPEGEFTMGSTEAEVNAILQSNANYQRAWFAGELPQHKVYLDTFYIAKNVVTVKQYLAFCAATDHAKPPEPSWGWKEDHPIVNVRWNDANDYCAWLSKETGLKVSLPTEAQWEKAARGANGLIYPWGSDWDGSKCANSVSPNKLSSTMPVGSYAAGASPYGVLDMAGNVWQWCADWYDENYYKTSPDRNPPGPATSPEGYRVLWGGSWSDDGPVDFRCAVRGRLTPVYRFILNGFRCVVRADTH